MHFSVLAWYCKKYCSSIKIQPLSPFPGNMSLSIDGKCCMSEIPYKYEIPRGWWYTFLYCFGRRKIRLIEGNARCRQLKNWPVKGLFDSCLSVWGPEPHSPNALYTSSRRYSAPLITKPFLSTRNILVTYNIFLCAESGYSVGVEHGRGRSYQKVSSYSPTSYDVQE